MLDACHQVSMAGSHATRGTPPCMRVRQLSCFDTHEYLKQTMERCGPGWKPRLDQHSQNSWQAKHSTHLYLEQERAVVGPRLAETSLGCCQCLRQFLLCRQHKGKQSP